VHNIERNPLDISAGAWSGAFIEAVQAVERGWSVVPWAVGKKGDKYTKQPDFALLRQATGGNSWSPFKKRQPTSDELAQWRGADYFAVIPGELSGVLVLDVDPGADLAGLHLPETPIAKTSRDGGFHYYFAYPHGVKYRQGEIMPHVDLPAVAVLPNGRERRWHISPKDCPLAHAPTWLVSKLQEHHKPGKPQLDLTPPRSRDIEARDVNDATLADLAKPLPLRRERLNSYFANEQACCRMVARLMELARVDGKPPERLGQSFPDILPGTPDTRPSATLVRNRQGRIVYKSHRRPAEDSIFALPDVLYSLFTGKAQKVMYEDRDGNKRGRVSTAVWALRLLWETFDFVTLPHVPYKALGTTPHDAPGAVRTVYDGFLLLAQLRALWEPGQPFVYSRSFAATWCQVGERQAGEAIAWLYRDHIENVGKHGRYSLLQPATGERADRETQQQFVAVGDVVRNVTLKIHKGTA